MGIYVENESIDELSQRYLWAKMSRLSEVEETPLTNLAAPAEREESASYYLPIHIF